MATSLARQATDAAYGWGVPKDWNAALRLLEAAAKAGEEGAARQYKLVTQRPLEEMLQPPTPERLHPDVRIARAVGFAPPGFADWLIERSRDHLIPAVINDVHGVGMRTATTCGFGPDNRDLVVGIMQERAARLLSAPVSFHEPPSTIHYAPGQEFRYHADFVEPSIPEYQEELRTVGQRVGTFVTYLNADFEGAETEFPEIGLRYRGEPGDAIFWANVMPDGSPDYRTGHLAQPPASGEKWVFSQWIRAKPFDFGRLAPR